MKYRWFRRVEHKSDLIAWLSVLSLGALGFSMALQKSSPWLSDLCLNLGAILLTFLVAVLLVDEVIKRHDQRIEEESWGPVRPHIGHYVGNVANKCALAYRIAVGIGDDEIPRDELSPDVGDLNRLTAMARWIERDIIPRLPQLERLDRQQWQFLLETLREVDADAKDVLLFFGARLKPQIHEPLHEIRRGVTRAHHSYELFWSVLGGTHDPKFVSPAMHLYPQVRIGLEQGIPPLAVLLIAKQTGVQDAIDEAEQILRSAVRLLNATIPLLPATEKSQAHG